MTVWRNSARVVALTGEVTLLNVTCTVVAEVFWKSRRRLITRKHSGAAATTTCCLLASTHKLLHSFTPSLPTLPFLLLNGISVATKAGSLALQPQPTKLASTQSLIMANPAADPKAAPLADDLKEFALYVYASNR
jgi:hypothetical protein